jgi:high affinity Mn2+ porin
MTSYRRGAPLASACLLAARICNAGVDDSVSPSEETLPDTEHVAIHGQVTFVEQATSHFTAPYAGPNSLSPHIGRETADATLYLGARLGPGCEFWINPELDQGFGLNNTLGMAGFPSAEAYKVGRSTPYLRWPRIFLRQTINLGAADRPVDAAPNQLAGAQSNDRLVFTVGKFSVVDVFDSNRFAHDPRADFLNWAAVDAGTFDYAADAWGYTVGAASEWYQGRWTLRLGVFDLSDVPNSAHLEPGFHEFQKIVEVEHRHELAGREGKLMLTAYDSRGRMALLNDAVAFAKLHGGPVDPAAVRRYRDRYGLHLNVEQQVTPAVGLFLRVGGASGNVEAYEFTDIDRSASGGVSVKGIPWARREDTAGLALVVNEISGDRKRYLAAGGLGILVGDGRLPNPGREQIVETYYDVAVLREAHVAFDYQYVRNPAYNNDRGPVSVFAVRLHAQL